MQLHGGRRDNGSRPDFAPLILQDLDIFGTEIGNQLLVPVARDEVEEDLLCSGPQDHAGIVPLRFLGVAEAERIIKTARAR